MKAIKLAKKLIEVAELNPNAEAVLYDEERKGYVKFEGFSVDDLNDVVLEIISGDKDH